MSGQDAPKDQGNSPLQSNRSDFVLPATCENGQNTLLDQTFFPIDSEAFFSFAALCDAPVQVNSALDALLASASPWEIKIAIE